jgi:hypothetical protein
MTPLDVRALATRTLIVAGVIAGCLGATYVAATLALQRPDAWRIDAALASRLTADYSTDDYRAQARAPLNPGVVDAARDDEQAADPARTPPVAPPASTVEPPATATPQLNRPPAAPAASSTPQPVATDTPEPGPSDTAEPDWTNTPVPSPTATPRTVTCGDDESGVVWGGACKTPSATPTKTPAPPTPTITPTATPRSIIGCLPLVGGLVGGDKCGTPTPEPSEEEGGG